jgi:hypothetical protein
MPFGFPSELAFDFAGILNRSLVVRKGIGARGGAPKGKKSEHRRRRPAGKYLHSPSLDRGYNLIYEPSGAGDMTNAETVMMFAALLQAIGAGVAIVQAVIQWRKEKILWF